VRVGFPIDGAPLQFETKSLETPRVTLLAVPTSAISLAKRAGNGIVLVLLLAAALRLGLLRPAPGTHAKKALALLLVSALAALTFVHVAFAAIALVASLGVLVLTRGR
jgi:hypothetical protein